MVIDFLLFVCLVNQVIVLPPPSGGSYFDVNVFDCSLLSRRNDETVCCTEKRQTIHLLSGKDVTCRLN